MVQNFNMPWFIRLGDKGFVGNSIIYSNSTMATTVQSESYTYQVEPYDANNLIFNMITSVFNNAGVLQNITQNKYLVNSSGTVSLNSEIYTVIATGVTTSFTKQ